MRTRDIDYRDGTVSLCGYLAWDERTVERRPGVLVFHEGLGLGEFAMARARMLAELGYVALAADMFGDRRQAHDLQEASKLVGELRNEPAALRARRRAALTHRRLAPSASASAARWCLNSCATPPTSGPRSASTVSLPRGHRRLPAR